LIATGEPPFRDRQFDRDLVCDIMGGLRPSMPDSAPEEYKELVKRCCDADPDKRPVARTLWSDVNKLVEKADKGTTDSNAWNTIYHNDVKPLSRFEKKSKYSSTLFLPEICLILNQEIWIQQQVWLLVGTNKVNLQY